MGIRKYLTAKAVCKQDTELASEMLDTDIESAELDPEAKMLSAALDSAVARNLAGLDVPSIDPLTGLVLDSTPELMAKRTGLEELDVQEIRRHRYDGQYPGEPNTHFLGGSNEITFGNCDGRLSEAYDRVKEHAMPVKAQRRQRDAYHQLGFIADRLNLPEPIKEDVCRAYTDLKEKGVTQAYALEKLLGLLAYVACKIHGFPRDFDDVREAIDELYGLTISRSDVTSSTVRAFNKGPIRFGIQKQNGQEYLRTWKRINSEQVDVTTLGRI